MRLLNEKSKATLDVDILNSDRLTRKGNLKGAPVADEKELQTNIDLVFNYWKKRGFPYYPTDKQWRDKQFEKLQNTDISSIIKDDIITSNILGSSLAFSFMPHHFKIRCGKMRTPMEIYNNEEHFKKGIKKLLIGSFFPKQSVDDLMPISSNLFGETTETTPEKKFRSESIMRALLRRYTGTQCVSNFRPTAAAALYRKFCKTGDTVWDMSMGYGGRLLGAILAKVNYVGTDPCGDTYNGLVELRNQYGNFNNKYKLLKQGSESLLFDEPALDFAFTSPPYFDWEHYDDDDESQSYLKWSHIADWKLGFLFQTINNAFRGLKLGKYCAINVANTKNYPTFEDDTRECAEKVGFTYIKEYKLALSSQEQGSKYEPVFLFQKKKF